MALFTKPSIKWFQKKYIAFFTITPLLLATALVQVDDPVCDGTGVVSSAPGMENVQLIDTESHWKYTSRDMNVCGAFVMYLYDVTLSVVNKGADDTWGYVKLVLVDLTRGEAVDTQYVVLEAPGGGSSDVSFTIWFQSKEDLRLLRSEVRVELIVEDVPDATCDGTGKIPLNSWLFINAKKDILRELGREVKQYTPPPQFDPGTEQWTE